MKDEFEKVKLYFIIAILFPIIFLFIMKINLYNILIVLAVEFILFLLYKSRLSHFKFIIEKNKKDKAKPEYIISTNVITKLPDNVITYDYKFVDYTIHDIYDKSAIKKQTKYRVDNKFCYVYYIDKGKILEVKRKLEYEKILKQNFLRHENRGKYGDWE